MHDYTKRVPIRSNLNSTSGYIFMDMDTIIAKLRDDSVDRQFVIKNSGYELFIYISRLSSSSRTFLLNVELYNEDYNEVPIKNAISCFESETEFRNFIKTCVSKFVTALNSLQSRVKYFEESGNTYDVHNNRMYIAIYDFKTEQFLDIPEVKELTIQFEDPDVDRLIENIMKE